MDWHLSYTIRYILKFVGALAYATVASMLLSFIFALLARASMSWYWWQFIGYAMLAIATLYVIRITVAPYIVDAPLNYLCDDGKVIKVLPIVTLAYFAVVVIVITWQLYAGTGSTYKAVLLNIPVVLYYGALIISYIFATPPLKISPQRKSTTRKSTTRKSTYEVGDYVEMMDHEVGMVRMVIVIDKNDKGDLLVGDPLFDIKQWLTPEELAEADIHKNK